MLLINATIQDLGLKGEVLTTSTSSFLWVAVSDGKILKISQALAIEILKLYTSGCKLFLASSLSTFVR
jgi:hypothetical protein